MTIYRGEPVDRYTAILEELLDKGYTRTVGPMVEAMAADLRSDGILGRRLAELEAEARRLAETHQVIGSRNAVVRALFDDLQNVLQAQNRRMTEAARTLQVIGRDAAGNFIYQTALPPGVTEDMLSALGVSFNRPDPEAIINLIDVLDSPAWGEQMRAYNADVIDRVNRIILRGVLDGQNPLITAQEVAGALGNYPQARANMILRTLQLNAYRQATALHERANRDIFEFKIRIEALDSRTCFACWGLHGMEMPVGEPVIDHPNGRASSIIQVRGFPRNIERGEDILNRLLDGDRRGTLSQDEQRIVDLMKQPQPFGHGGAFDALQAGAVQLGDFLGRSREYSLWGSFPVERSLREILGEAAEQWRR